MAADSPFGVQNEAGPPERTAVRGRIVSRPSWLTLFYGAELLVAAALFGLFAPRLSGDVEILALLIILNSLALLTPISIYGDSQITPGFVLVTGIIILFGPAGAAIASPIEAALGVPQHRFQVGRMIHGAALLTIVHTTGAWVYQNIAHVNPAAFEWQMVPAVGLMTIVCFSLNVMLVGVENRLRTGQDLRAFWEKHGWIAPNYITLGIIGLALAAAYIALGIAGILIFVAPALMMRLSMKLYVDKTKENVAKLEMQNDALRTANIEVRRVSEELRVSYDGTLEALVNALDARDQETKGHSLRVSRYMMDIAREMGVVEGTQDWIDMQRGSLLHDVGKIGVSDSILLKPSKLTEEEWASMRQHPEIGYNMLKQVKFLQGAAEIILCHHERWDGHGYPRGLNEDEIPLGARIFTVVDTFDSMTSDRPYRKALTTLDALNEIMRYSGTQFDPRVVEAFLDIYEAWVAEREELHRITVVRAAA
jgi:putative nucleotidyltransferase with HDIG domain